MNQAPSLLTGFKIGLVAVAGILAAFTLLATVAATTTFLPRDGSQPMSGTLDLASNRIVNVASATAAGDAVSRAFGDSRYCQLATCAMAGTLNLGNNGLTNVASVSLDPGGAIQTETTTGNTVIFRARDTDGGGSWTTFGTLTAGSTPSLTLDGITMSGTWLASGTVTLPAVTLGGTVDMGTNEINWTETALDRWGANILWVKASADVNQIWMPSGNTQQHAHGGMIGTGPAGTPTSGSTADETAKFSLEEGLNSPVDTPGGDGWNWALRGSAYATTAQQRSLFLYHHLTTGDVTRIAYEMRYSADEIRMADYDINLLLKHIKTTNFRFYDDGTQLVARNLADNAYAALLGSELKFNSRLEPIATGLAIVTPNSDDATLLLKARDNGVGWIDVGRLVSAADPYLEAYPLRLKPVATASLPATPVEGMLVYDDTANKLKVYNGSAWETVTSSP